MLRANTSNANVILEMILSIVIRLSCVTQNNSKHSAKNTEIILCVTGYALPTPFHDLT